MTRATRSTRPLRPDGQILYVRLNDAWTDHEVIAMSPRWSRAARWCWRTADFFDYHYGRTFGYPLVSPDGRHFLFRSQRSGWTNIWVAPLDGGEPRQVAPAEADQSDAAWSPDGQRSPTARTTTGRWICASWRAGGWRAARARRARRWASARGRPGRPMARRSATCCGTTTAPNDVWTVRVADGARRQLTDSMLGGGVRARLTVPEKVATRRFDG